MLIWPKDEVLQHAAEEDVEKFNLEFSVGDKVCYQSKLMATSTTITLRGPARVISQQACVQLIGSAWIPCRWIKELE